MNSSTIPWINILLRGMILLNPSKPVEMVTNVPLRFQHVYLYLWYSTIQFSCKDDWRTSAKVGCISAVFLLIFLSLDCSTADLGLTTLVTFLPNQSRFLCWMQTWAPASTVFLLWVEDWQLQFHKLLHCIES